MHKIIILFLLLCGAHFMVYGQDHVFVFLNSKPDKKEISEQENEALQKAHRANIELMVEEGKMIVAGPFEGGGGIFIFKSGNVKEATEWLSSDPAIKANRWDIELFPVTFLKGEACVAAKPHEMVVYGFTRVRYINDIANYKANEGETTFWSRAAKSDSVLVVGSFPVADGGIIIYRGEYENLLVESGEKDHITLEEKKLWVVKGSFCEDK